MLLPICKYPSPVLAQVCEPVGEITPEIRKLAADMAETMYEAEGIGLAAPQVGVPVCMVVIDISGPEERAALMTLINPRLTLMGEEVESEEGCLSVEEYRNTVLRSSRVRCEATDLEGNPVDLLAEEILAICLQHEIDHLKGVLFLDHLSRLKRSLFDSRLRKQAKRKDSDE